MEANINLLININLLALFWLHLGIVYFAVIYRFFGDKFGALCG